jgi:hypothetical protein
MKRKRPLTPRERETDEWFHQLNIKNNDLHIQLRLKELRKHNPELAQREEIFLKAMAEWGRCLFAPLSEVDFTYAEFYWKRDLGFGESPSRYDIDFVRWQAVHEAHFRRGLSWPKAYEDASVKLAGTKFGRGPDAMATSYKNHQRIRRLTIAPPG